MLCFAEGTRIETAGGPVPVERLAPGHLARTLDHGWQPVRWIGTQEVDISRLRSGEAKAPVRIARGAFGPDVPVRDVMLSAQHRVLLANRVTRRMFAAPEILVGALHLCGLDGVDFADGSGGYPLFYHILCDRHEIVFAEGMPAETLYPGPLTLNVLPEEARRELGPDNQIAARPFASGAKARNLAQRLKRSGRPLLENFGPFPSLPLANT